MDGLTTTSSLRAAGGKFLTLPIIAFTANAFADDREACERAGMTDFVAKPVRKKLLVQAVLRACSQHVPSTPDNRLATKPAAMSATRLAESNADILDPTAFEILADAIDFDDAIETYRVFIKDARRSLQSLATMEFDANRKLVRLEAHTLKSIAASFGFHRMSELAKQLESAAMDLPEPEFRSIMPRIDEAFERGKTQFDEVFKTAA
jgi:hypothetical protein